MKIAIIGYGGRGRLYSSLIKNDNDNQIVAICDIDKKKLELSKKELGVNEDILFDNDDEFFKEKRADILFVCTQDESHHELAINGLNLGYDLLLEKPIATNIKECKEIEELAVKLNRKVSVCHVLRYAPFFREIKELIDSRKYGKVVTINMTENVAYWHHAHSYVRGNWRNDNTSTPMIIAKCCHDLDLISWFINDKCDKVSSFGSLSFFKRENAKEDSSDFCVNCKYKDSCEYSATRIYLKDRAMKGLLEWPCDILVNEPNVEKVQKAIENGPYGRCVFKCDNNVVDHQIVNMEFKNGATASLTMTAFSKDCYREIHVHLEHGDISGNMKENKLYIYPYNGENEVIDLNKTKDTSYGHGGGDIAMLNTVLRKENSNSLTSITDSMQSHYIGYLAEKSRKHGGKVYKV